jgi:hypothetical protein
MARVIGTSGAWSSVLKLLPSGVPRFRDPGELNRYIAESLACRPHWREQAEAQTRQRLQCLAWDAAKLEHQIAVVLAQTASNTAFRAGQLQAEMDRLSNQTRPLLRIWARLIQRPIMHIRLFLLMRQSFFATFALRRQLRRCRRHQDRPARNFTRVIDQQVIRNERQLTALRQLAQSPNCLGAITELAVIDELRQLPDDYTVLNDVQIGLANYVRIDGDYLKSAQIDHIVVGPSGVFVLEAKNWSQQFAESGSYFNPYKQVRRARYACQLALGRRLGHIKVRNVIVSNAALPPKPSDIYVKILKPGHICGYILWFVPEVPSNEVAAAVEMLRRYA